MTGPNGPPDFVEKTPEEPPMNPYPQSADTYLAQRVLGASPEQQAALLMEGGQLFLGRAIKAMEQNDHFGVARCLRQVTEIINEALFRLNHQDGGELVENLAKVYDWWTLEIFEASKAKDAARLAAVSRFMGEIRQAWEQVQEKQTKGAQAADFLVGNRVV
jgi:flagellar secretion chaperone FliS